MGTEKNAPSPTMQCRPNCLGHFFGEKPLEFHMEAIYYHIFIANFKRGKSLFKLNTFILWGGRRELPATHLPAKFVLGPEKWSPILVCACRTYLIWQEQLWIIRIPSGKLT